MRKFFTVLVVPAVSALLAIAAACDDDTVTTTSAPADTSAPSDTPSTAAPDAATDAETSRPQATTTSPPSTTATVAPEPAGSGTTSPPDESDSGCAEGGTDEAIVLQDAFEQGHQPWRGSPESVAEAGATCALGTSAGAIEPAGTNRYRAIDTTTNESVTVEVAQPLGPGTVWLISSVTAT